MGRHPACCARVGLCRFAGAGGNEKLIRRAQTDRGVSFSLHVTAQSVFHSQMPAAQWAALTVGEHHADRGKGLWELVNDVVVTEPVHAESGGGNAVAAASVGTGLGGHVVKLGAVDFDVESSDNDQVDPAAPRQRVLHLDRPAFVEAGEPQNRFESRLGPAGRASAVLAWATGPASRRSQSSKGGLY